MRCNVVSLFDCLIPSSMISSGRCLSLHLPCVGWCIATCVNDKLVCAPSSVILPGQAALLHLSCVWSCSDAYVHDERKVPTDEETDMQTFGIYRKQLSNKKNAALSIGLLCIYRLCIFRVRHNYVVLRACRMCVRRLVWGASFVESSRVWYGLPVSGRGRSGNV